jgi:hypothetical protein
MSNVSYIKIFNQIVDEFFNELIEMFPDETKIKVHYNLFQTMCKTNAKKPCNDFMIGSIPYLEKIAMKDENFFLSQDKPSLLSSMNIEKLWGSGISENTKNAIWNYIKSFFVIGIKIIEMPQETLPLINFIIN